MFKSIAFIVGFTGLPNFIRRNIKREIPYRFRSYSNYAMWEHNHGKNLCHHLEKIHFESGEFRLDIGCGFGGGTVAQAEANKDTFVIGLDINADYLKIAKELGRSLSNICFVRGDAHYLCFKNESIDSITSTSTFEHLKYPDACLKEMRRILKNTGFVYITFDQFWGPFGGHLRVYLPFPWVHYLPQKIIRTSFKTAPNFGWLTPEAEYEQFLQLNRWSTSDLVSVILKSGFRILQQRENSLPFFRKFLKHFNGRLRDFSGNEYSCLLAKDQSKQLEAVLVAGRCVCMRIA